MLAVLKVTVEVPELEPRQEEITVNIYDLYFRKTGDGMYAVNKYTDEGLGMVDPAAVRELLVKAYAMAGMGRRA